MIKSIVDVMKFKYRLQKASEVLKERPSKNFFERMSSHFEEKGREYISATDYYPKTNNKSEGWGMITSHNRNNREMLMEELRMFCLRVMTEMRINDFNYLPTEKVYGDFIDMLQKEKERLKGLGK